MEEVSEAFKSMIPELESKIRKLKTHSNDPIEYVMVSDSPDQVLLSEMMRESIRSPQTPFGIKSIPEFLMLLYGEAQLEQAMDEQRSKLHSDVLGLFEDLKEDILRIINTSYKAFMNQQPLLGGNPVHEFMVSCLNGKISTQNDLENSMKSLGMLLYHKKVEKGSFDNVPFTKLQEIMSETKGSLEKSLLSLTNSLQQLIQKTQESLKLPFKDDADKLFGTISLPGTPRISFGIISDQNSPRRSKKFFTAVGSPTKKETSEKAKGFIVESEPSSLPICGKGRGIVCTQKRKNTMYFTLGNDGTVSAFEEKIGADDGPNKFQKVYSRKFDVGGEDLNHSISLNPSETYLSVSGMNTPFIYIMQLGGKVIQAIKNSEKDQSWMFGAIWVNNYLIATGFADGKVKLFKYGQDKAIKELRPFKQGSIFSLASDIEGEFLYCGCTTGHVGVISLTSKSVQKVVQPMMSWVHYLVVDDENKFVACGGEVNEVVVLSTVNAEVISVVKIDSSGEIQSLAFCSIDKEPTGISSGILSNDSEKLLVVSSENEVLVLKQGMAGFIGFRKTVWEKVWEAKKPGNGNIQSAVLQRKRQMLLVGSDDGSVHKLFIKDNVEIPN